MHKVIICASLVPGTYIRATQSEILDPPPSCALASFPIPIFGQGLGTRLLVPRLLFAECMGTKNEVWE